MEYYNESIELYFLLTLFLLELFLHPILHGGREQKYFSWRCWSDPKSFSS